LIKFAKEFSVGSLEPVESLADAATNHRATQATLSASELLGQLHSFFVAVLNEAEAIAQSENQAKLLLKLVTKKFAADIEGEQKLDDDKWITPLFMELSAKLSHSRAADDPIELAQRSLVRRCINIAHNL
jgi:hypothetical protein